MATLLQPGRTGSGQAPETQGNGQAGEHPGRSWNPFIVPRDLYQREQWNWQTQQPVSLTVEVNGKRDLMKYAAVMQLVQKLGFVARLGQPGAAAKFQNLHLIDVKRRGGTDIHVTLGDLAWTQSRASEAAPASAAPARCPTPLPCTAASPSLSPDVSEPRANAAEACVLAGGSAEGGVVSGSSSEGATTTQILGSGTAAAAAAAATDRDTPGTSSNSQSQADAASDQDATGTSPSTLPQGGGQDGGCAPAEVAAEGDAGAAGSAAPATVAPPTVLSFRCGCSFCPCHLDEADLADAASADQGAVDPAFLAYPMTQGRRLSGSGLSSGPQNSVPGRLNSLPSGAPLPEPSLAAGGPLASHLSRDRLRNLIRPSGAAATAAAGAEAGSALVSMASAPAAFAPSDQANKPAGNGGGSSLTRLIGWELVLPAELAAKRMDDKHVLVQYEIDGEMEDCKMQYRLVRSEDGRTLSLQGISRPLRGLSLVSLDETEEGDLFMRTVTPGPDAGAAVATAAAAATAPPPLVVAVTSQTAIPSPTDSLGAMGRTASGRQRKPSLKAREGADKGSAATQGVAGNTGSAEGAAAAAAARAGSSSSMVPALPPLYPAAPSAAAGAGGTPLPSGLPTTQQPKRRGRPPKARLPAGGPAPSFAPVLASPPPVPSTRPQHAVLPAILPAAASANGDQAAPLGPVREDSHDGISSPARLATGKRSRSGETADVPAAANGPHEPALGGDGASAPTRRRRSSVLTAQPPGASPAPMIPGQAPGTLKRKQGSSSSAAVAMAGVAPVAAAYATPGVAIVSVSAPVRRTPAAAAVIGAHASAAVVSQEMEADAGMSAGPGAAQQSRRAGSDATKSRRKRITPASEGAAAAQLDASGAPSLDPPAKRPKASALARKSASRGSVPSAAEADGEPNRAAVLPPRIPVATVAVPGEVQISEPSPQGSDAADAAAAGGSSRVRFPRRAQPQRAMTEASASESESESSDKDPSGAEDGASRPLGPGGSAAVAAGAPGARKTGAEAAGQAARAKAKGSGKANGKGKSKPVRHPSQITNVVRNAGAILLMIGRSPLMYEKQLRSTFGNNPDTSKALRLLEEQGRVVRGGAGYRMHPYHYTLTPAGIEEYERLLRDKGPSHAFAITMGVKLPEQDEEEEEEGPEEDEGDAAAAAPAATPGQAPGQAAAVAVAEAAGGTGAAAAVEASAGVPGVSSAGAGATPSPGSTQGRGAHAAPPAPTPEAMATAGAGPVAPTRTSSTTLGGGGGGVMPPGAPLAVPQVVATLAPPPAPVAADLLSSGGSGGPSTAPSGLVAMRPLEQHQLQQQQAPHQVHAAAQLGLTVAVVKPEATEATAGGSTVSTGPIFEGLCQPTVGAGSPGAATAEFGSVLPGPAFGVPQALAVPLHMNVYPQPQHLQLAQQQQQHQQQLVAAGTATEASIGTQARSPRAASLQGAPRPATSSTASQQQSYQPQMAGTVEADAQAGAAATAAAAVVPAGVAGGAVPAAAPAAVAAPLPPAPLAQAPGPAVMMAGYPPAPATAPGAGSVPTLMAAPAAQGQMVYANCPPMAYAFPYHHMPYAQHPHPHAHPHPQSVPGSKTDGSAEQTEPQATVPYRHPYPTAMYSYVPTPFGYMPYPMYGAYASGPAGHHPGAPPGPMMHVQVMPAAAGMHPHPHPHAMGHAMPQHPIAVAPLVSQPSPAGQMPPSLPHQHLGQPSSQAPAPVSAALALQQAAPTAMAPVPQTSAGSTPAISPVASPTGACQAGHMPQPFAAQPSGAAAGCMLAPPEQGLSAQPPQLVPVPPTVQPHALPATGPHEGQVQGQLEPQQPQQLLLPPPPQQQQQQAVDLQQQQQPLSQAAVQFRYVAAMPCGSFRAEVPGPDGRMYYSPGFGAAMKAAAAADLLMAKLRPAEQLNLGISAAEEATLVGLTVEGVQAMLWTMSGQP